MSAVAASTDAAFPRLLSPLDVGPVTLPNRVVFTAHTTNMSADENLAGAQMLAYYRERARGGAGLIVLEASAVHPGADIHGTSLRAYDPRSSERYSELADAIRAEGGRFVVQLFHTGAQTGFHKTLKVAWAPSSVPSSVNREIPHVMDRGDIDALVESFAVAARNVRDSSADGVEVHLGHSYLLAEFLSPAFNHRDDEFGGSLENRMRLSVLVLERVREALGPQRVLGVRVSGEEHIPDGLRREEMGEVCAELERRGLVDYVNVSVGSHHTRHMMVAPMSVAPGYLLDLCADIRKAVDDVPVSCIGRVNTPELAERVLADGIADLVGMTRAQIAEPQLVRKLRERRRSEIRPCIGSNQGCRGRFFMGLPIACTVNPAVGFEATHGVDALERATQPRDVLVVGAGPAGLKAAEIATRRGHRVIVCERADEVGGQLRLARELPGRAEIFGIAAHLAGELERLGVELRLGVEVDPELIAAEAPDAVVVATGSQVTTATYCGADPRVAAIAGVEAEHVLTADDVLRGAPVGRRVLIVAEEPGYKGWGLADRLSGEGHTVTLAGSAHALGEELAPSGDFQLLYPMLLKRGVRFAPATLVTALGASGEEPAAIDVFTEQPRALGRADTVVVVAGREPDDALYARVRATHPEVHCIGDALAPRRLDPAIFEGDRLGREL